MGNGRICQGRQDSELPKINAKLYQSNENLCRLSIDVRT